MNKKEFDKVIKDNINLAKTYFKTTSSKEFKMNCEGYIKGLEFALIVANKVN